MVPTSWSWIDIFGVSKSNTNILNLNPPHQLLNYYKGKKKFVINYETSFVTSSKICDIPNISKRKKNTNFYLWKMFKLLQILIQKIYYTDIVIW